MSDPFHALEETITADVTRALAEDVGAGDLTAALVPEGRRSKARLITRQDAVLCGTGWFNRTFQELDTDAEVFWHAEDGQAIVANGTLCEIDGDSRALLTGERTALNFLQLLSGVATRTRRYVDAVAGTNARILDTRKTLPGLRIAQKYAVRAGGGMNHRIGLHDGVLIKENHIAAAGSIRAALEKAIHDTPRGTLLEIEVENLNQLEEALNAGAKLVLLDNFGLDSLRAAVKLTGSRAELEASGGVNLGNVRAIAETGVHRISVGSLTKDVEATDFSLRFHHP
ncbi:carboxylating nicotinate-nucleotide diphosphorylase [Usitatibacter palustris]|uniref:Probable nicotinate-nucleotide pyrophosphorylase [carboxylating] n=1 Tax=Usitatibacter palustris TaxID=2732487 RepID=A0A6M4H7N2_9PROT|nr:carboxylating nicotinate-nucleotide diphosphorylase [Usitatibacter palustris]QJR15382.1 Nicotinate-nucleotide pyrophosphorylase [carboxylating] [Usitatibacter palustris]